MTTHNKTAQAGASVHSPASSALSEATFNAASTEQAAYRIDNLNVRSHELLTTPDDIKAALPRTDRVEQTVSMGREAVKAILEGKDHRLAVVVGPCSIHDTTAAIDYAKKLKALADEVSDTLLIVMRVYFEKPRTTVGWKGLINDPYLNGSFAIEDGMRTGRKLLLDIAELGCFELSTRTAITLPLLFKMPVSSYEKAEYPYGCFPR